MNCSAYSRQNMNLLFPILLLITPRLHTLHSRSCTHQVYGPLKPIGIPDLSRLVLFEQTPFLDDYNVGFGELGMVYIPKTCSDGAKCGLQVTFHGCGGATPPDVQAMGYAESNGIVLLHPNVPSTSVAHGLNGNNASKSCNAVSAVAGNCKEISRGCWDGYGQLSEGYVLQSAAHMRTVWRMVAHVAGGAGAQT
jgi:hypothetical protein